MRVGEPDSLMLVLTACISRLETCSLEVSCSLWVIYFSFNAESHGTVTGTMLHFEVGEGAASSKVWEGGDESVLSDEIESC